MKLKRISQFLLVLGFVIFATSCATTVNVIVTRPAEVDFYGAESIAILPFGTEGSVRINRRNGKKLPVLDFFLNTANKEGEQRDIASFMQYELESDMAKSPYVKLIDSHAVMSAINRGNDLPADLYLTGDITSFSTKVNKEQRKEKSGEKTVIKTYYNREVYMRFDYQVVDGKTSEVLYQDNFYFSKTSSDTKDESNVPSPYDLVTKSLGSYLNNISHKILPYDVNKTIFLVKPKNVTDDFKKADIYVRDGETQIGYELFLKIYENEDLYEAGYNAAALLEAMGRYEEAKRLAEELAGRYGNKKVKRLIMDINNEIEMEQKFKAQRNQL